MRVWMFRSVNGFVWLKLCENYFPIVYQATLNSVYRKNYFVKLIQPFCNNQIKHFSVKKLSNYPSGLLNLIGLKVYI